MLVSLRGWPPEAEGPEASEQAPPAVVSSRGNFSLALNGNCITILMQGAPQLDGANRVLRCSRLLESYAPSVLALGA